MQEAQWLGQIRDAAIERVIERRRQHYGPMLSAHLADAEKAAARAKEMQAEGVTEAAEWWQRQAEKARTLADELRAVSGLPEA
jgi:hypothetical protein